MPHYTGPLLTRPLAESLTRARDAGTGEWTGSLDLGRSTGTATLAADHWQWKGQGKEVVVLNDERRRGCFWANLSW